jgi:hypothetical protein
MTHSDKSEGIVGMTGLSPDQYGIATPEVMDTANAELNCQEVMTQWCRFNDGCTTGRNGATPGADSQSLFLESYPDCAGAFTADLAVTPSKMNNGTFDIKSPNFLGGPNVHNLIIITLCLLILVSTAGGNLLTAPLKAAKKAV